MEDQGVMDDLRVEQEVLDLVDTPDEDTAAVPLADLRDLLVGAEVSVNHGEEITIGGGLLQQVVSPRACRQDRATTPARDEGDPGHPLTHKALQMPFVGMCLLALTEDYAGVHEL